MTPLRGASAAMKTFSGLRSRWITPTRCAASSASRTGMAAPTAASTSKRPTRVSADPTDSPSRYSITMYGPISPVPASITSTTFGWRILLIASASWKNRCATSMFCARSGWRNLIATGRPAATLSARKTSPIPPLPTRSARRYLFSTMAPGVGGRRGIWGPYQGPQGFKPSWS